MKPVDGKSQGAIVTLASLDDMRALVLVLGEVLLLARNLPDRSA